LELIDKGRQKEKRKILSRKNKINKIKKQKRGPTTTTTTILQTRAPN
jgi:hypothetical protein